MLAGPGPEFCRRWPQPPASFARLSSASLRSHVDCEEQPGHQQPQKIMLAVTCRGRLKISSLPRSSDADVHEHDHEQKQHHHAADVDQNLHAGDELRTAEG